MALGSTGEFLYLDTRTRKQTLELILSQARGLPVIANISHIRLKTMIELGKSARDAGADAVAILPPYFYRMRQADIAESILQVGDAAGLPLWLYNFPERTGNSLELETIAQVAERLPVVGVKQSGTDFDYHVPLVQLGREKRFVVFTGADTRLPEAMALGVKGCIGGLVNAAPEWVVSSYDKTRNGSPEEAQTFTANLREIERLTSEVEFPLNVAAAMEARGLAVGHHKTALSSETVSRYHEAVQRLRQWYARHFKAGQER
jgi:dihydrodipicolinate synthase/N-acetylneuraminate lyase